MVSGLVAFGLGGLAAAGFLLACCLADGRMRLAMPDFWAGWARDWWMNVGCFRRDRWAAMAAVMGVWPCGRWCSGPVGPR